MQHHFDVELAKQYGMVEAVLLNHFEYWIELNRANGKNYFEGRYWTFNSMKAFAEIFPYLSEKKIRNALKNLQDAGLIMTGNFNKSAGDLVDDYIRRLDEKPRYIPTGIGILDRYLHLSEGDFLLIGGRPSAGKTALSLQMAVEQAMRGYRVCYFSLETSDEVLTRRIIANRLCVPLADVQAKRVPLATLDGLARLRRVPLYIRSAAGKSVGWMRAQAARKKAQVVYVDYVQIIPSDSRDRYTQITRSSIALHELAQTTGMVVVGVAQLNRSAAHADPTTADLKESGQLEQDADAIILLGGPGSEHPFTLAKNKEGRTGDFQVRFDKEKQRFLEVTP